MTTPAPTDPMAMFRDMVGQWEKLANDYGGQMLQRPEAVRAMQTATSAGLQIQAAVHEAMTKVLAGANMPTRAEVAALGERMTAIEATLARIEHAVAPRLAEVTVRPTRGRTPTA